MNKIIEYIKKHWFVIIAVIMLTYIVLFDLTIDFTWVAKDASSKTEFHYLSPFKF